VDVIDARRCCLMAIFPVCVRYLVRVESRVSNKTTLSKLVLNGDFSCMCGMLWGLEIIELCQNNTLSTSAQRVAAAVNWVSSAGSGTPHELASCVTSGGTTRNKIVACQHRVRLVPILIGSQNLWSRLDGNHGTNCPSMHALRQIMPLVTSATTDCSVDASEEQTFREVGLATSLLSASRDTKS
jgi:hypothetical protein